MGRMEIFMKKIIAIALAVCAVLGLAACANFNIKEPDELVVALTEKGCSAKLIETQKEITSFLGFFGINDIKGITDLVVADGSEGDTVKPLMVAYCNSKEAAERVRENVTGAIDRIADFFGVSAEACKVLIADNAVLVGHPDMMDLAKGF